MKEYYLVEVKIRNIYQERVLAQKEFILLSNTMSLDRHEKFATQGVNLVLRLRMLTVQLVYAVRRWKDLVKRSNAVFTISEALKD